MGKRTNAVAWMITEPSEGHSVIAFHQNEMSAWRAGAADLNCDREDTEIERMRDFDQFAEAGDVPKEALLKHGWWFACSNCGSRIDEDSHNLCAVVFTRQHIYCDQECQELRRARIAAVDNAHQDFIARVKAEKPDLEYTSFTGGYPFLTSSARFTFPGAQHGGSVHINDSGSLAWSVALGDLHAWNAYTATLEADAGND